MPNDFSGFPNPPMNNGYMSNQQPMYYNQQYQYQQPFQQPVYSQQIQTPTGPVQAETYAPGTQVEPEQKKVSLGASFGSLIGTHVPASTVDIVTETTPAVQKKSTAVAKNKKKKDDDKPVDSKSIVENTVYADTYADTNMLTYGIIAQTDQLLSDAKRELDTIRTSRTMKGKYAYMTKMIDSMASLFNTKMQAIKELNTTIKNANDMEYRRFKDNRALSNEDDNKLIMDAYKAFISAPVGAPAYTQPNTMQITGMEGVVPANAQSNDSGLANYLSKLTPEENMMLNESNPNIEEVIEYDDMTGVKRFKWIDKRTNQEVPNMPKGSDIVLEDYIYDPRTGLAKNTKLNTVKKVVHVNGNKFNEY